MFQVLTSSFDEVATVLARVDDVAELFQGCGDVCHVEDDPVDCSVVDSLLQPHQKFSQPLSYFRTLKMNKNNNVLMINSLFKIKIAGTISNMG